MDAHANLAVSLVATAPSPASSGTSLVVTAGQGSRFPAAPFNCSIWPASTQPDPSNCEIVRVTARSTDTLTITRAQEGTSARTVVVGDQIAATITAKTLTDVETVDAAAATGSLRTLGTGALQALKGTTKLDELAAPTDVTTLDATTSLHGLLPKLPNDATKLLNGLGAWTQTGWVVVAKASDESVASSVAVQNDDELFFATVSGAQYQVEIVLVYGSPAGAGTPDLKVVVGEDSTARGVVSQQGYSPTDVATFATGAANQTTSFLFGTAAADRVGLLFGTYTGAAGTFRVQWAQNTSGANATIVRAGSVLRYRRIV